MTATCPCCGAYQSQSLACHECVARLEKELASVRDLMTELDISISKQAKIGTGGKAGKGGTHERWPINLGASAAAWDLDKTLTKWADTAGWVNVHPTPAKSSAVSAAWSLLNSIPNIRRHPEVVQLVEQISDVIRKGRQAIDRPADRVFVGPCMYVDENEVTCLVDLFARPNAAHAKCGTCGITHEVAERRHWMLDQARDRLFTVREAAQMVGHVGRIKVTEDRIRGYLRRGRLAYHPIGDKTKGIRLGDLLTIVVDDSEKKGAA